jgi:hypothetical protein
MILASHGLIASSILQVDPDWLAYYNRVIAAGGSLSTTEQDATKTLVADLKSAGIWSAMKAVYPMVGASAAACAQNLKSSSFTGTFTSGWTFASTGATPNGTSAYMDTGLKLSTTVSTNNYHLSFYSRTQDTTKSGNDMGANVTGGNNGLTFYFSAISIKFFATGAYPTYYVNSTNNDTTGFLIGNRQSATSAKLIQDNTTLTTSVVSDSSRSANNMYLGASNADGTSAQFQNRQCAFSSIGDGLTDTQASNFYTAVQAFQTTLTRQV